MTFYGGCEIGLQVQILTDFTVLHLPNSPDAVLQRSGGPSPMVDLKHDDTDGQDRNEAVFCKRLKAVPFRERVSFAIKQVQDAPNDALEVLSFLVERAPANENATTFLIGLLEKGHPALLALLVKQARQGDQGAIVLLQMSCEERIYRYIVRRLDGKIEEAKDVTQETFIQVWRCLPTANDETEAKFVSWVYRIAENKAKAYLRRKGVLEESLDPEKHAPPLDGPEEIVCERELRIKAYQQLSPEKQKILRQEGLDPRSQEEKARSLGIKKGTYTSTLARARKEYDDNCDSLLNGNNNSSNEGANA